MSKSRQLLHEVKTVVHRRATLNHGVALLFLLFWSTGFSVVKIGLRYANPLTFLSLRYLCVIAILLPIQVVLRLPIPRGARRWLDIAAIGFMIQFVYFCGVYLSLRAGLSAGTLALIVSMQPILVGFVSPLWTGESTTLSQWAGLILGFLGALFVIVSTSKMGMSSFDGIAFAVAALLGMTFGVLYEKRTASSTNVVASTLIQSVVGLALAAPLAFVLENNHIQWTTDFFMSLSYLVVFNSVISIVLLLFLFRNNQATKASALFFLVPPGAALAAKLLLGESMPALAWLGFAVAALGLRIATT